MNISKKFGYKMKCENCMFGCLGSNRDKIKRVFCGRLQIFIPLEKYKKMRVCIFFRKDNVKCL